jgi:hypothetical protein
MKQIAIVIAAGLAFAATLPAAPALATGVKRSFVSAVGNDSNVSAQCPLSAPCRTFAAAYSVTMPDGEIDVLDPASYGTLTIGHGLSIQGHGWAAITAQSGTAITIAAGPSDKINLEGLLLDGAGAGATGISFAAGSSLAIENLVIRNFTAEGIAFFPNAASNLSISNALVADNNFGIFLAPSGSGLVTAVFNRVEANNNTAQGIAVNGLNGTGTVNATVSDSVAAHNGGVGFRAISSPGQASTTLMLFHCVAANNGEGLEANGLPATLRVAQSVVTGNTAGWQAPNSGVVQSYGDNYIDGNVGNEATPPPIGKK